LVAEGRVTAYLDFLCPLDDSQLRSDLDSQLGKTMNFEIKRAVEIVQPEPTEVANP
jgi:hypothetical protein